MNRLRAGGIRPDCPRVGARHNGGLVVGLALILGVGCRAYADPEPLADIELAAVAARDGFSIAAHLQLESSVQLGFDSGGHRYFFVIEDFGGSADFWSLTVDLEPLPDGSGGYLRVGMPTVVNFQGFGVGAAGVTANPTARLPAASSLGQLRLDGTASMGGSALLWSY